MFGSGVTIGKGTVLLPSAYMAPEAQVGDGRVVGALATSAHPTRRNRCGGINTKCRLGELLFLAGIVAAEQWNEHKVVVRRVVGCCRSRCGGTNKTWWFGESLICCGNRCGGSNTKYRFGVVGSRRNEFDATRNKSGLESCWSLEGKVRRNKHKMSLR